MNTEKDNLPNTPKERHSLISKRAYDLSQSIPDNTKSDLDYWFWAENQIDNAIFTNNREPCDFYKSLMIKFFSSIEMQFCSNEQLAINFFDFIRENNHFFKTYEKLYNKPDSFDFRNVSIMMKDNQIDFLTKRSLMIADATLLSHSKDKFINYREEVDDFDTSPYHFYSSKIFRTNCYDIQEFGQWLRNCQPLLINGDIFYYPQIEVSELNYNDAHGGDGGQVRFKDYIFDAIVSSKKVLDGNTNNSIRKDIVKTIVELDIPYIDVKQMIDFSKICIDEHNYLDVFRSCIREHFVNLIANEGSESFEKNITQIGLRIKNDVRLLTNDIKNLKRKRALLSAGTLFSTITASLVAIDSNLIDKLPEIICTSGALGIAKININYDLKMNTLKNSPYYYLWLLSVK